MTLDEVKSYFVTGYRFEQQTGMGHSNFVRWRRIGYIPMLSQGKIEAHTNGALIAEYRHGEGRLEGIVDVNTCRD